MEQIVDLKDSSALPSGYHLIGHVALLRLNDTLQKYAQAIGEATIRYDKRIKTVAVRTGETTGIERTPHYQVVAGLRNTETVHIENGVKYSLDPLRITFSGGNVGERIRMAKIVQDNESVVDMFACVGQFSLPMARNGASVIAIEINPIAYQYLIHNVKINRLEDRVSPRLGDSRIVHPFKSADRVVMGYLHNTIEYLPAAIETISPEGGVIHMHQALHPSVFDTIKATIVEMCRKAGYSSVITAHRVKMYARCIEHVVFDIHLKN